MVFSFSLPHQVSSLSSLPLFNFFFCNVISEFFYCLHFSSLSHVVFSLLLRLTLPPLCSQKHLCSFSLALLPLLPGFSLLSLVPSCSLVPLLPSFSLLSLSSHVTFFSLFQTNFSLLFSQDLLFSFSPQVSLFSLPPKLFSCHSLLATPTPSSWLLLAFTPKPFFSYSSRNLSSYFPSKLFSIPYFLSSQAVLSPKPFSFSSVALHLWFSSVAHLFSSSTLFSLRSPLKLH